MSIIDSKLNQKTVLLKEARLQLLKLHKLMVDYERAAFEKENGQLSSGQFLNVLINDQSFQWLKRFSTLIVEIDEMFDLNDGISGEMIENNLRKMENLLAMSDSDEEFRDKYTKVLQSNVEINDKHEQLKNLLIRT